MFNKSGCEWRMNKAVCWNLQVVAGVEISASESETLLTFVVRFETEDKEINDNSTNTQTTVSSLTHISWQADLSTGFRTLLRWTTPLTHLCCSWEKNCRLHSTTVTQRGRLNPPQRFKPQQIHTDAPTEAAKHIFQQRPLNVLWPGSEPYHLCVHTCREAVLQHVEETDWRDSGKSEGLEETLDSCRVSVATSSSQTHLHSHYHGAETSPDTSNTQRHASNAGEFFSSSQPQRQRRSLLSRWGHRW